MALSRNPIVARLLQSKAYIFRQRPIDLEHRLRALTVDEHALGSLVPASAWRVFKAFSRTKCFADSGWLVEYGVFQFTGQDQFHFSLTRQIHSLRHSHDEFHQVRLELMHAPTPRLRDLTPWHMWSFDYKTLDDFFAACERFPGCREVLAFQGAEWRWNVRQDET